MRLPGPQGASSRRGSLLVPIVAAITILSLAGIVLSQTFGAQRIQSALGVQSARAFWISEAGAWHAAMGETDLSSGISFDLGSYRSEPVAGSGDELVVIGQLASAARRAAVPEPPRPSTGTGPSLEVVIADPLDETAAAGSIQAPVAGAGAGSFSVTLLSDRTYPSVLASLALTISDPNQSVTKVSYGGVQIVENPGSGQVSPVEMDLSKTDLLYRIVDPSSPLDLQFKMRPRPRGTTNYSLLVRFTDGTSSRIPISIDW